MSQMYKRVPFTLPFADAVKVFTSYSANSGESTIGQVPGRTCPGSTASRVLLAVKAYHGMLRIYRVRVASPARLECATY